MKATLVNKKPETSDVTTYQFQTEQPVQWQAGQFIEYHLPHQSADDRGESRYFTVSSAPHEDHIQITTRLNHEHSSTFKAVLDELKEGDQIEISEPMGEFVINEPEAGYVFISGGIGVTPFRSILLDLAHKGQPINVALLYASRNQEIVFNQELEELAAQHPSLTIQHFIGDQRIELSDITKAAERFEGQKVYFYISGPKPMVGSYKQQLKDAGYQPDQIMTDYFPGYSD